MTYILKLECTCHRSKDNIHYFDAGILGEFILILCDFCDSRAQTSLMNEFRNVRTDILRRALR